MLKGMLAGLEGRTGLETPENWPSTYQKLQSGGEIERLAIQVAQQFGLVFALSESLRPIYAEFGIDLPKSNGTDTFELPVPATFVIDSSGTIRAAHINADYKQRMEPAEIVKALREMT